MSCPSSSLRPHIPIGNPCEFSQRCQVFSFQGILKDDQVCLIAPTCRM